jgi:geranylgeranyl pyrophosphate synthase
MVGGQSTELELMHHKVTPAILEGLDRLKTGALITTALRVGAMLGGAPRKDLDRVTRYGDSLGLAFQITDDILDADEVSNGNPNQKRMANYLSVTGLARTKERVKDLLAACLKEMQPYGSSADALREIARYVAQRTE